MRKAIEVISQVKQFVTAPMSAAVVFLFKVKSAGNAAYKAFKRQNKCNYKTR